MKYKKGDLVKVIETEGYDEELYGVREGKTYEVLYLYDTYTGVYINAGKDDRVMYNHQIEKVKKKKSKKDLRIEELEKQVKQIQNILNK